MDVGFRQDQSCFIGLVTTERVNVQVKCCMLCFSDGAAICMLIADWFAGTNQLQPKPKLNTDWIPHCGCDIL